MRPVKLPEWLHTAADRVRWPFSSLHTLIGGMAALALGLTLYTNCGVAGCPDTRQLAAYQSGGAPELLDRQGRKFADLAPFERVVVPLDSLPPHVASAFIAVEDRRFHDHNGVDWRRVFGATLANLRARGVSQGSSTITMQLARNVFPKELPGAERTMKRKLQETRVARQIEARFEKHEILEMYLNHIYFGGGAYGVQAASRLYFDKPATELTVAEAATLAALPKAPSTYDPRRRPERAKQRRDLVLSLMEQQRLLHFEEAAEAREEDLVVRNGSARSGVPLGAWFIDVVRDVLEDRFGEELYRSKLRIYTTLDSVAQSAAERHMERQLEELQGRVRSGEGELQGALVMMDAATGDVRALVGGRDPTKSRYNRALHARRQVGSAFKPFVYAAALDAGVPTSQVLSDAPLTLQLSRNDVWEPGNYDGTYEGDIPLRQALVRSRNVPTVRLATNVGIPNVANFARAAGITADMDETPALSLGTVAMSPLQLASAYTTFATLGHTAQPRFVIRVEDGDGRVLMETEQRTQSSAVEPAVAYIVTDILRDAVNYGTGTGVRSAGFNGPVAGKTGTTNNATDAWFVGYTPEVVSAVWIGYDRPSPLGSSATGGGLAAPVFGRVLRDYYRNRNVPDWNLPAGVVQRNVDPYTGFVLQDGCLPQYGSGMSELFTQENVPAATCPYRDWWGDFWNRIGGIFGGDDEDRNRGRADRGRRGGGSPDELERQREESARQREEMARQREREMEEFLRQRAEQLRRAGRGNGRGN